MGITESIIHLATRIIEAAGYPGLAVLMVAESMVLPVPSEAVMPFAGFLWFDGTMTWWAIALWSTAGSIVGSLLSYWIGAYGGRPLVRRFGRYLLLNEHHLDLTEQFFRRYGEKAIFFSRFIPVIRHLISLPAGVGRMRLGKFTLYTAAGAVVWNTFLAWVGYTLGSNWDSIRRYTEILDVVIVIAIVAAVGYFVYRQLRQRRPPTV